MSIRCNASGDVELEVDVGAQDPWTITFWMKRVGNGGGWDVPLAFDSGNTTEYSYITRNGTNNDWDSYSWNVEHNNVLDTPPTADAWYFVAMVKADSTTWRVYWKEDGDASLTDEGNSPGNDGYLSDTLRIFDSPWGGEWFNGSVSSVKMWDVALTKTQIEAEMDEQEAQKTSDLIGEWHLKDTTTMTTDSSGNGNTLSGGTGLSTDTDEPDDLTLAGSGNEYVENCSAAMNLDVDSTDKQGMEDSLSAATNLDVDSTDKIAATEAATAALNLDVDSTDGVGITDALSAAMQLGVGSSDAQAASESASAALQLNVGSSDTQAMAEALSAALQLDADSTDTYVGGGTAYDESGRIASFEMSVDSTDVAGFLDAVAAALELDASTTDTAAFADSLSGALNLDVDATDTWAAVDALTAALSLDVDTTDAIGMTESAQADLQLDASSTDVYSGPSSYFEYLSAGIQLDADSTDTYVGTSDILFFYSQVIGGF